MIKVKYVEPIKEKLIAIDIFDYIQRKYDIKLSVSVCKGNNANSYTIQNNNEVK